MLLNFGQRLLIINYASLCTSHKVKVLKAKPYIPHTKLFTKFLLSKSEKSKKWGGYRPKRKYGRRRSLEPSLNHFLPLPYLKKIFEKISVFLANKLKKW